MIRLTEKEIEQGLKEINCDDLRTMFDSSFVSTIKTKPIKEVVTKLEEYWKYVVPVSLGDIIKINDKEYVVTCLYTDNSVDLLDSDREKKNKGLYKVLFEKVGELQCIIV